MARCSRSLLPETVGELDRTTRPPPWQDFHGSIIGRYPTLELPTEQPNEMTETEALAAVRRVADQYGWYGYLPNGSGPWPDIVRIVLDSGHSAPGVALFTSGGDEL